MKAASTILLITLATFISVAIASVALGGELPTSVAREDMLAVANAKLAYELAETRFALKYHLEKGDSYDVSTLVITRAPKSEPAKTPRK